MKKCSIDGRAIMQMDVQTVQQHFQAHYPFKNVPSSSCSVTPPPLNLDFRYVGKRTSKRSIPQNQKLFDGL